MDERTELEEAKQGGRETQMIAIVPTGRRRRRATSIPATAVSLQSWRSEDGKQSQERRIERGEERKVK